MAESRSSLLRRALGALVRHPRRLLWLAVAVAVIVALALLAPALGVLGTVADGIVRALDPLVRTPTGRLVLLNLLLFGLGVYLLRTLRASWRALRGDLAMRRHLRAVDALVGGDSATAARLLARVARHGEVAPASYPALASDAALKLARLELERGDARRALRRVLDIVPAELPDELARSHAQLRLRAEWALGETLPDELARALREALDRHADDLPLWRLCAEVRRAAGDLAGAVAARERAHELAPGPRARRRALAALVDEHLFAAERLASRERPDLDAAQMHARRAAELAPDDPRPSLALGDLAARRGAIRDAVAAFGASPSDAGLERVAELLDAQPDALSPRELLELAPSTGAIGLAASLYLHAGDRDAALRAVRLTRARCIPPPWLAERLAAIDTACRRPSAGSGERRLPYDPDRR
ncbi:MAG: hypothetical protein IPM29_13815 [Planctomycetes bacterium]|nr:hypothetical protein [Planctomycetota bacterium]